jgi:hypothetical protein
VLRGFAHVCVWVGACVWWGLCVSSERVCACPSPVRALSWHGGDRLAVFIARPATRAPPAICLSVSRALAAGAMWRCRTTIAPWAGRYGHTTVIDAAGAIYVIGGYGVGTTFNDVWVSTDGGARRDSGGGYTRWVLRGYYKGRYSRGSLGIPTGLAPSRPTHKRISDHRPCRSRSVAGHVNAAADAIACMACMPLGKNCVLVDSCGRARLRVC